MSTPQNFNLQIGNTPLVALPRLFANDKSINVFAKLEYYNPSGSIKDRIVDYIIRDAEASGKLKPGGTIIEATTGNTGAATAFIGAQRGYRVILTTMEKVSSEKKDFMRMLGAELIVCPTEAAYHTPEHYVIQAKNLAAQMPGALLINQYDNPLNVEAHYKTTGPEIWQQMGGNLDYFVTSGSTGGTVSGTGKYLKQHKSNLKVVLPDPVGSIYYHYVKTGKVDESQVGSYQVEGVGEDHLTKCFDASVIDDAIQFNDEQAFGMVRLCAAKEGILPGLSAGGNLHAVQKLIEQLDGPAHIVTIIQDAGVKYLSKLLKQTSADDSLLL